MSSQSMADQVASVKASYPTLTITDTTAKQYIKSRGKWFKSSIAVCCVYGTFALFLLLLAIFSEQGKMILSGYLMPFTTTLIGGMLFIVLLLVIQISTFKPSITNANVYDGDICPDFWKLEKVPESDLTAANGVSQENNYLMQYRCKPDQNIFALDATKGGIANVYGQTINTGNAFGKGRYTKSLGSSPAVTPANSPVTSFLYQTFAPLNGKGTAATVASNKTITGGTLNCDVVYPNLLASEDKINFPNAPNALRCAYAQQCGIPWTGVCPNPPITSAGSPLP